MTTSPSAKRSSLFVTPPSPAPFVGSTNNYFLGNHAAATPPRSSEMQAMPSASIDLRSTGSAFASSSVFATPPMSKSSAVAAQRLSKVQTTFPPTPSSSSPPASLPAPSNSSFTVAPLTPPLTPPCFEKQQLQPPAPFMTVSRPPTPAATPVPQPPPTLSARLLQNHRLHPSFARQYMILEELGSGGFGFVIRAARISDGAAIAVKFIYKEKVPSHGWVNTRHWGDESNLLPRQAGTEGQGRIVPMEAYILRNVRHSGVVAFIDLFEDDTYFYLVMEHHGSPWQQPKDSNDPSILQTSPSDLPALAAAVASSASIAKSLTMTPSSSPTNSPTQSPTSLSPPRAVPMMRRSSCDLFECIEQHSRFTEDNARYIFAQIVEIVAALNQMGVCHRDIKDENIVIDTDFKVKLIDFGSAVIFDPRRPAPYYNRFYGTTSFASAEILRGEPYQATTSEIWSLGVLLSILVTGECPFSDASAAASGRLSRPKVRLSTDCHDLMLRCLNVNVKRRITIEEMRQHPWVANAMLP